MHISKLFNKFRPELAFNKYSLINSLKAALACALGLSIAKLLHLTQPQWVLMSIVIVMAAQYRLGAALKKGYARIFATALGSSLASIILFLFANDPMIVYSVLFLCITFFIYLAGNSKDYSYAYTLGAVTMVIIVISDNPQFQHAFDRLIEILLGVTIAILVSRFVFPIHAEKLLYKKIAEALDDLKTIYKLSIHEEKTFKLSTETKDKDIEGHIIQNFALQPTLLKEACIESIAVRKKQYQYLYLLRLQRRLLRCMYMLHYTLRMSLKDFSNIINMSEFKDLHRDIILEIKQFSIKIQNNNYVLTDFELQTKFDQILIKLHSLFTLYDFEQKNKIHAYIFCQEHVIRLLTRMKKMIIEIKGNSSSVIRSEARDLVDVAKG